MTVRKFRSWCVVLLVLCLGVWGCKKDKKAPTKRAKIKRNIPTPKKLGMFDVRAIDRVLALSAKSEPLFAKVSAQIPLLAKACKKQKKYLSSFTYCSKWKSFTKGLKPTLKAAKKGNVEAIDKVMALALAGVAQLRDEDAFVRYAGLRVLEQVMYHFAWKKIRTNRHHFARAIAYAAKNGTEREERKQAARLLGNDGGTAHFQGGVYDGKVLAWLAHMDKDKWVRRVSVGYVAACVKKIGASCPVTPKQLKAWYAKETDGTVKEGIAKLAGMKKMTEEVFTWCTPRLMASTLYWGCRDAFKSVLNKGNFERFNTIATKYIKSEGSQSKGNFRTVFVIKLMLKGKGFPEDKVAKFLWAVLKQSKTATARTRNTTVYAVKGLVRLAKGKRNIRSTRRKLRRIRRKYKRLWRRKYKKRKSWVKIFDDANKVLKKKR